ncbi:MAG: hypothetical protein V3U85_01050, partial [Hyphomicrobium sp.]
MLAALSSILSAGISTGPTALLFGLSRGGGLSFVHFALGGGHSSWAHAHVIAINKRLREPTEATRARPKEALAESRESNREIGPERALSERCQ